MIRKDSKTTMKTYTIVTYDDLLWHTTIQFSNFVVTPLRKYNVSIISSSICTCIIHHFLLKNFYSKLGHQTCSYAHDYVIHVEGSVETKFNEFYLSIMWTNFQCYLDACLYYHTYTHIQFMGALASKTLLRKGTLTFWN